MMVFVINELQDNIVGVGIQGALEGFHFIYEGIVVYAISVEYTTKFRIIEVEVNDGIEYLDGALI